MIIHWKHRNLTPLGRLTVLKTLLLPTLNHIFASLPNPTDLYIKDLENTFYSFVMGSNAFRLKKGVCIKDLKDGGFKMISIKEFIMSLKLVWMKNVILQGKYSYLTLDLKKNSFLWRRIHSQENKRCKKKCFGKMF